MGGTLIISPPPRGPLLRRFGHLLPGVDARASSVWNSRLDKMLGMWHDWNMTNNHRSLARSLKAIAWCGIGGYMTLTAMTSSATPTASLEIDRPLAEGSPAALIQAHDCWVGEGPQGVIPGHVVVTKGDAVAPTYGGPALTGKALAQVFDGVDNDLTIHAFCR